MSILICAATSLEIAPLLNQLGISNLPHPEKSVSVDGQEIHVLITGVGLPIAAANLALHLSKNEYQLAIQAGIAGALDRSLGLGDVVNVFQDRFADLGVEEADGRFTSVYDLGLSDGNVSPFSQYGWLTNPLPLGDFLPNVVGVSVNKVHGHAEHISAFRQRIPEAQVESMEGASFAYVCQSVQQPYLQVRSISNYVESRNRNNWKISQAVDTLNTVIWKMVTE